MAGTRVSCDWVVWPRRNRGDQAALEPALLSATTPARIPPPALHQLHRPAPAPSDEEHHNHRGRIHISPVITTGISASTEIENDQYDTARATYLPGHSSALPPPLGLQSPSLPRHGTAARPPARLGHPTRPDTRSADCIVHVTHTPRALCIGHRIRTRTETIAPRRAPMACAALYMARANLRPTTAWPSQLTSRAQTSACAGQGGCQAAAAPCTGKQAGQGTEGIPTPHSGRGSGRSDGWSAGVGAGCGLVGGQMLGGGRARFGRLLGASCQARASGWRVAAGSICVGGCLLPSGARTSARQQGRAKTR